MCDQCSETLVLINNHHSRHVSGGSTQLSRDEVDTFIRYAGTSNNKKCMCIYKDFKNFDKVTNLVQVILNMGIELMHCLPDILPAKLKAAAQEKVASGRSQSISSVDEDSNRRISESSCKDGKTTDDEPPEDESDPLDVDSTWNEWNIDDLRRLIDFQRQIFLSDFLVYFAYKMMIANNMEDLSSAETTALHNYCEISEIESPVLLLRNVCFFIDSNGIGAMNQCFQRANSKNLPVTFAHSLLTIITQMRVWVNTHTMMSCILQLRLPIIRYMCTLSESDMRAAAAHSTMDMMWSAIKEPIDTQMSFDKEAMALVYKCFTSTTLTIRLGSIHQISLMINSYNDNINNESMGDVESFGNEMAKWLLDNKIVEQIFGPNLHIEIIKQSQIILNFLGTEGRINNQHLDCIWAAAQLKHCGKQVYEVLLPLIKSIEPEQNRHLRHLIDKLDPACYNESVLYLSSILTRSQWQAFQMEEARRRKLASTVVVAGTRRAAKASVDQISTSDSESDDSGVPPPSKMQKCNPEICGAALGEEIAGTLGSEEDHCCIGPGGVPQPGHHEYPQPHHTHHHMPQHAHRRLSHHQHHHLARLPQPHFNIHHVGLASDSSAEGHSDLSYEEDDEDDNARFRALVQSVTAKNAPLQKHPSQMDGGESSDDEGGAEVVVNSEGIPIPRMVVRKRVGAEGFSSKPEVNEETIDAIVEASRKRAMQEEATDDEDEEEDEDEEDEEDEDVSTDNEDADSSGQQPNKEHEMQLHLKAEKVIRHQRLANQFVSGGPGNQSLVEVHDVDEDDDEEDDDDDEDEEEEEMEEVKEDEATAVGKAAIKLGPGGGGPGAADGVSEEEWQELHQEQVIAGRNLPGHHHMIFEDVEIEKALLPTFLSSGKQELKPGFPISILSPDDDEGSCHSSRISNKSEKNMADFDGEEVLSEEELAQINAHVRFNTHQPTAHIAALYHPHARNGQGMRRPKHQMKSPASDFRLDDVCKPGHTLLWDLVQDNMAGLLPEGIASEAEKALKTLLCCSHDRQIRTKFIEAVIENLAKNKSVVVSLRLLTKLFSSFNNARPMGGSYKVVLWTEKSLHMMTHFFNNLVHFTSQSQDKTNWTSHHSFKEEVSSRLDFLSCVFSSQYSPDSFRLSQEQADKLWVCLAQSPESCEDCLSWFYDQARGKENHALNLDTFKHIFINRMPQLKAETMPMIGLNLFQQLSNITCMVNSNNSQSGLSDEQVCGMDQLWEIALKANNKSVSTDAIHILNNYYINYGSGMLDKEEEFVQRCMNNLMKTLSTLKENPVTKLPIIQRGLVLLKHHLDAFRQRYAYHLHMWGLNPESGGGITSHQPSNRPHIITVYLQTTDLSDKTQIEMHPTSLVSELRAEVTYWWEELQNQQPKPPASTSSPGIMSPLLGSMLGEGPLRMISSGQELTVDMDERCLGDLHMSDGQHVFVSVGANRQQRKSDGSIPSSCLPVPDRKKLPMNLLIAESHFDNLFKLMEELSDLGSQLSSVEKERKASLQAEARRLSRDVWELLMILPTNESLLNGFMKISTEQVPQEEWNQLLPPSSPHRLYYSLQTVEFLANGTKSGQAQMMQTGVGDAGDDKKESGIVSKTPWCLKFISKGGLNHMMNIFMNGSLQPKEGNIWSQWSQECLGYLLRLISQFSVDEPSLPESEDSTSPRRRLANKKGAGSFIISTISKSILEHLDVQAIIKILMQILFDAAMPMDSNQLYCGTWGRREVVQYAMSFLVSLAFSCDQVLDYLCNADNFDSWLKRLTLEAPEAHVRIQACLGLHRLCLGKTKQKKGTAFLAPVLEQLLTFLSDTELFKPKKYEIETIREEKEIYGAGCQDYFIFIRMCLEELDPHQTSINMNSLLCQVTEDILSRPFYETYKGYEEDEGLLGLLNVASGIYRHNPDFADTEDNVNFLSAIFDFLFLVPSPMYPHHPKCKSLKTRQAAYDLLAEMCSGNMRNYTIAVDKFMKQNTREAHAPYPWDYWPQEDGRAKCGYVGLTNLGATCYMATAIQHLFMIPRIRQSVIQFKVDDCRPHASMMVELQRMFAYLQESERRAYSPKSFCKTYTMDRCPLNTGEQKDMQEFFTDIITKLEETSPQMKTVIKEMFGGETANNVVSLDCSHVSRTFEEFYTIRCGVAHMKDLYESLDEVTVKDMLEGDNMYTCSQCHKKVRAEKRTCFRKLPQILCFNTLRYSFNMLTMMKEKVNTHFSFPNSLDMSRYMEQTLIGKDRIKDVEGELLTGMEEDVSYEYKLIGVTVHVGSAEGGHYYNLIKDTKTNKWYHFNDADVKPFDASNIPHEAFGGEMNGKTYDTVSEKYLDFPIEKTNSAYMLFYERVSQKETEKKEDFSFELSTDLADWIWSDNTQFLKDRSIFDRMYFDHVWQMCSHIPSTLHIDYMDRANHKAVILASCFVLETFIHAKEKKSMPNWIDYLMKKFNSCLGPCEWLLDHMAQDDWWLQHILIKCPNNVIRQMFQRLLIMMISQLSKAAKEYIVLGDGSMDTADLCNHSCLTRFIAKLLSNLECGMRPSNKYLSEYFTFLSEFAKLQESNPDFPSATFLNAINTISMVVKFYMGSKASQPEFVEIVSDEDEDEEVIVMSPDEARPTALSKMISLIAYLVEASRDGHVLQLSDSDMSYLIRGRGHPFLMYQVRDNINIEHTCNLIVSLCMSIEGLAVSIVNAIFNNIKKLGDLAKPFFDLLTRLTEFSVRTPGYPPFTQYIISRLWELTKVTPRQCLDWLTHKVIHNCLARQRTLDCLEGWVEPYMVAYNSNVVRMASAQLLVSLVPNDMFRTNYRPRVIPMCPSTIVWGKEDLAVMHRIYQHLLMLLKRAHVHIAPYDSNQANMVGPSHAKLMSLFSVLNYCLYSRREKLMFTPFFLDLWQLFHPFMLEPQVPLNHNKQALLIFWYNVCTDCPENLKQMVENQHVCKNIGYNYILADHEDEQNIIFNRCMLPAYYGLLRMACEYSSQFMRQLAVHQNLQWAFKNILPYHHQYSQATEELKTMMRMMAERKEEHTPEEAAAVENFRKCTLANCTQGLDPRVMWQTLLMIYKSLIVTPDDYMALLYQNGLSVLSRSFFFIYTMFHEATACHMTSDMIDVLQLILSLLIAAKDGERKTDIRAIINQWNERNEVAKKLLTLLNSFVPNELRGIALDVLHKMVLVIQKDITQFLTSTLVHAHTAFQNSNATMNLGPFFPTRSYQALANKANVHPTRPQFQMFFHGSQIEAQKGKDEDYDRALMNYYEPYHRLIDRMCRMAINHKILNADLINLYAMVAYEGVPMHLPYFAKLWNEIIETSQTADPDHTLVNTLCKSNYFIDYIDTVLLDERRSLNNDHICHFFRNFFPKVHEHVITDGGQNIMGQLVASIVAEADSLCKNDIEKDVMPILSRLLGELRAIQLVLNAIPEQASNAWLSNALKSIVRTCRLHQQQRAEMLAASQAKADAEAARREREERKQRVGIEKEREEAEKKEEREEEEDADQENKGDDKTNKVKAVGRRRKSSSPLSGDNAEDMPVKKRCTSDSIPSSSDDKVKTSDSANAPASCEVSSSIPDIDANQQETGKGSSEENQNGVSGVEAVIKTKQTDSSKLSEEDENPVLNSYKSSAEVSLKDMFFPTKPIIFKPENDSDLVSKKIRSVSPQPCSSKDEDCVYSGAKISDITDIANNDPSVVFGPERPSSSGSNDEVLTSTLMGHHASLADVCQEKHLTCPCKTVSFPSRIFAAAHGGQPSLGYGPGLQGLSSHSLPSSSNQRQFASDVTGLSIRSQGADLYEKVIKAAEAVIALLSRIMENK